MFEKASRLKLRFGTPRGVLSVEDLWDLDVRFLDNIYKDAMAQIKEESGDSLLNEPADKEIDERLQLSVDIIKHIVQLKLQERDAAKVAAQKQARKQKLMEILAEKQEGELREKSIDELRQLIEQI